MNIELNFFPLNVEIKPIGGASLIWLSSQPMVVQTSAIVVVRVTHFLYGK